MKQAKLSHEIKRETEGGKRAAWRAICLIQQGKMAEAKKFQKQADTHLKRARQLLKEIKT